jgi:hypothetical protein
MTLTKEEHIELCASAFTDWTMHNWWVCANEPKRWNFPGDISEFGQAHDRIYVAYIAQIENDPHLAVQFYNAIWKENPNITWDEVKTFMIDDMWSVPPEIVKLWREELNALAEQQKAETPTGKG